MKYIIDFDIGIEGEFKSDSVRVEFEYNTNDPDKLMRRAFKELDKRMGREDYIIYYWWWIDNRFIRKAKESSADN